MTGIVIQILCFIYLSIPLAVVFTIVFAFISHFLIDTLAKLTYHTPEPHKEDKIWVAWGITSLGITIAFVIWVIIINKFWFFFLGAFFSVLVDIYDWGILRTIQSRKSKDEGDYWHQGYFFHKLIDYIRDKVPPFSWLPNWNYKHKGIIPEVAIIIVLWISISFLLPMV